MAPTTSRKIRMYVLGTKYTPPPSRRRRCSTRGSTTLESQCRVSSAPIVWRCRSYATRSGSASAWVSGFTRSLPSSSQTCTSTE